MCESVTRKSVGMLLGKGSVFLIRKWQPAVPGGPSYKLLSAIPIPKVENPSENLVISLSLQLVPAEPE